MKTGDTVLITGQVYVAKYTNSSRTALSEITYKEPRYVLLLGKSKRFTGIQRVGWDEPTTLSIEQAHDVWMVMEFASNSRYRRPIPVLETQILGSEGDE